MDLLAHLSHSNPTALGHGWHLGHLHIMKQRPEASMHHHLWAGFVKYKTMFKVGKTCPIICPGGSHYSGLTQRTFHSGVIIGPHVISIGQFSRLVILGIAPCKRQDTQLAFIQNHGIRSV